MRIFGIAGWSGSGKTTLVVRLLPVLVGRGYAVSTMKHAHHAFDVDQPGKDSWEHRAAGATEVMITSRNRWALMHENRGTPEPDPEALVPHMSDVDLLLIEGFKSAKHSKLEVWRSSVGQPLLAPNDVSILAVATDGPVDALGKPVLDLDDVEAIADFIVEITGLRKRTVVASVETG